MMTAALKGKSEDAARDLFDKVHKMLTGESDADDSAAGLGRLAVLSGVCKFPARVKCASLAWHTVHAALAGQTTPTTTE